MNEDFLGQLLNKQQNSAAVPSNKTITRWALQVIRLLYPEQSKHVFISIEQLKEKFAKLELELCKIMDATKACSDCNSEQLAKAFFNELPRDLPRFKYRYRSHF